MNADFERELRAGMEEAPIRPRPDVVREAFRRSRRHRGAARAAVAGGTAIAAGIAAVILAGLPGPDQIQTTAYVVGRVNSALAAADSDIMYVHQSGTDPGAGGAFDIRYWGYGSQSRELTVYGGVPGEEWDTLTHVKQGTLDSEVSVGYRQRSAVKSSELFTGTSAPSLTACYGIPAGFARGPGTGMVETASWLASYMHALLACGGSEVTRNQRFDGTTAIEITGQFGAATWRIWVDQATFLPIADSISSTIAADGSLSDTFGWLPPTKANLANVTGQIPAGFTVTTEPLTLPTPAPTPAKPPAPPTVWGTGPAGAIARHMGAALNVTSHEILAERQATDSSLSGAQLSLSWIYPGNVRTEGYSAGKLSSDQSLKTTLAAHDSIRQVTVTVDYPHQQALRLLGGGPVEPYNPELAAPSEVCRMAANGQDPVSYGATGYSPQYGAGNSAAVLVRDLLACPNISVTISRNQPFNGADAIKVSWPYNAHSSDTFWLEESTYALIGVTSVTSPASQQTGGSTGSVSGSLQMRWLPPTKANLALLNVFVAPNFAGAS